MLRKRVFWFAVGLATTGAAITHFSLRDLWADFASLSYDLEEKFNNLETRVSNLEGENNPTSLKRLETIVNDLRFQAIVCCPSLAAVSSDCKELLMLTNGLVASSAVPFLGSLKIRST